MSSAARLFTVVAAVLAFGACSGGDSAAEASFLEGRDLVTVYRLGLPDGFDPDAFVLNLGEVFGIEGARLNPYQDGDITVSFDAPLGGHPGSAGLNMQTLEWGYTSPTYQEDSTCRRCVDSTVSEDEALARAKELFAATGTLVGEFQWEVDKRTFNNDDYEMTRVVGVRVLEGSPVGDNLIMDFGNGDQVLRVSGDAAQPVPIEDVGLLTPREALGQQSEALVYETPVESIEGAELAYTSTFNRHTLEGFLIPVYRFPLNAELGLTTDVLAIRARDTPG